MKQGPLKDRCLNSVTPEPKPKVRKSRPPSPQPPVKIVTILQPEHDPEPEPEEAPAEEPQLLWNCQNCFALTQRREECAECGAPAPKHVLEEASTLPALFLGSAEQDVDDILTVEEMEQERAAMLQSYPRRRDSRVEEDVHEIVEEYRALAEETDQQFRSSMELRGEAIDAIKRVDDLISTNKLQIETTTQVLKAAAKWLDFTQQVRRLSPRKIRTSARVRTQI